MATRKPAQAAKRSEIHERLRAARTFAGLSQSDLANSLGVSRGSIAQKESPNAAVYKPSSVEFVKDWARVCGVDYTTLFDDTLAVDDLTSMWIKGQDNRPALPPKGKAPSAADMESADLEQRTEAWRTAVRYDMICRDPQAAPNFDVRIKAAGVELVAPYLSGRILAAFSHWDEDLGKLYSEPVARMLLLERAIDRGAISKHLILLHGPAKGPGTAVVSMEKPVFGVHVHVVDSVQAATELLLSL